MTFGQGKIYSFTCNILLYARVTYGFVVQGHVCIYTVWYMPIFIGNKNKAVRGRKIKHAKCGPGVSFGSIEKYESTSRQIGYIPIQVSL